MAVLLGGRAAETLIFGKLSTGAADDLSKATGIARSMVTRYGMNATLGQMTYDQEPALFVPGTFPQGRERDYSDETAREIDCAVRALVEQASQKASSVLAKHRPILEAGALRLLQRETLSAEELSELIKDPTGQKRRGNEAEQASRQAIERGENEGMPVRLE
jgi:cell division protease FtsH